MNVNPWVPFAGALGYNVYRHLTHQSTLCSTARKYVPAVAMVVGWSVLTDWLVPHYVNGFKVELGNLSD